MRPCDQPRLDFQPILDWLRTDQGTVAQVLGCSRRAVSRRCLAGVSLSVAERCAHRLGLHPVELWGAEYYRVAEIIEQGAEV